MFDYENGNENIKDPYKRLNSHDWIETGIKFKIADINKNDTGKYQCEVDTGQEYNHAVLEVKEIFG